jgi:GTP-binding protein LepA
MEKELKIRNFCIIAHIDHGKSTLADRMLEMTETVEARKMQDQVLDQMDLEREKGITIKLQPVRMDYKGHVLNLIDTPGHVDFQYEVSRSLQSVEGAILLIDATQGIQAQTMSNLYMAIEAGLDIIPVINKIDLPAASVDEVKQQISDVLGSDQDVLLISAKTGKGVEAVLDAVIEKVRSIETATDKPLRALVFDSVYDEYKGVVAYVRVVDGSIKSRDEIYFLGSKVGDSCIETGVMKPKWVPAKELGAGEIGYIATGLKDVRQARVGDTIVSRDKRNEVEALAGFEVPQPKLFAGLYPAEGDDFPELREAIEKLQLNDSSLQVQAEQSEALGRGFRCGFLGMLHLEIVQERLKREWGVGLVVTTPSVLYKVKLGDGRELEVKTPAEWPDPSSISGVLERYVDTEVIVPVKYMGPVFELFKQNEGELQGQEYLGTKRVMLKYKIPLRELVVDLYDLLKSATAGYGSLSYSMSEWRAADVIKLDILINKEPVEALSVVVRREDAVKVGRIMVARLKKVMPKQQFTLPLQATIGGSVVARETLPALRKDVTSGLYGGDVTRKKKVLAKQKKGKKRLAGSASIKIPPHVYIDVLKR